MEVLGHPPRACWVRMKGVPLHICRESVFRKLGDCLGHTVEVDQRTVDQEYLVYGRVKILIEGSISLSTNLPLWFDDLST